MVRIVEAREKYENRADGRVRQRFMEMPDGTWAWVKIPRDPQLEKGGSDVSHGQQEPAEAHVSSRGAGSGDA